MSPAIHVLVRGPLQLEAVLAWRPPEGLPRPALVYLDFPHPPTYAEALARCHEAGLQAGLPTPRIAKPGEDEILQHILAAAPDAVLVRHLAGLAFLRKHAPQLPLVGDFSLNAVNEIAADVLSEAGLTRITPGYDLNHVQLRALAVRFAPGRLEPILHAHVPMMYMEHCIAAARLSKGRDAKECGRPCATRRLALADRIGEEHTLLADARCGSTLFCGRAQSAIELAPEMLRLGVRHFRVEFLHESVKQVQATLDLYAAAIAGRLQPEEAWRQLEGLTPGGLTRGTWDFN
jgi:putative protease